MNDNQLKELIEGCRNYDRMCQKEIYQLFHRYALTVALRYTASADEAREVVNDSFFQVFTKIDRFNPEQLFQPWLHTITVRSAIDYYRKYHQHKIALVGVDEVPEVAVHDHILSQIAAEDLRTLVQQLPPAYRLAINLYAIEGFAHHEIADMLGISEGASKSNLFKARAKLTKMLEQQKKPNGLNVNNTP